LSNTNKSATISILQKFLEVNKALEAKQKVRFSILNYEIEYRMSSNCQKPYDFGHLAGYEGGLLLF
jgi:hypothetical protein